MKTNKVHRFEKIFYSALALALGVSIGYYYAAASAAEMLHASVK